MGKGKGKKNAKGSSKKRKSKCRSEDPTFGCVFPKEIVCMILSRLPVKSLMRFRCVCKPWRKLISKPHFIATHLNHSFFQLLVHSHHCASQISLLSLFNPPDSSLTQLVDPIPFGHILVGSCNGIVCFSTPPLGDLVTLWNPAMRLSKTLMFPNREPLCGEPTCASMGFAYDSVKNDFLILRLWFFVKSDGKFYPNLIKMYSINNSRWKKLENEIGFQVVRTFCNVIIKGAPYWNASVKDEHGLRDALVRFDPDRKVFEKLPVPGVKMGTMVLLLDLNDCLAMIPCTENYKSYLDVWVFDNENGWSKKYNVGPMFGVDKILGCSRSGEIVTLNENGMLFLFDPVTSLIKVKVELLTADKAMGSKALCFNYSESLVLISGMTQVKKEARGCDKFKGHFH